MHILCKRVQAQDNTALDYVTLLAFMKDSFPFTDHHHKLLILIQLNAIDLYGMRPLHCNECYLPGQCFRLMCNWTADIIFKEVIAVLVVNGPCFILSQYSKGTL